MALRFGLHWGSTLYVGNVTTGGRSEVTALGDEVNEAAPIAAFVACETKVHRIEKRSGNRLVIRTESQWQAGAAGLPHCG